jgi:hypothetical protein
LKKSLAFHEEKLLPVYKRSKEWENVLACCKAVGNSKLKPAVVGRANEPCAFTATTAAALSVFCSSQKVCVMT